MTAFADSGPARTVQQRGGLLSLNVRAVAQHIYPGALVAHRLGSHLAEIPDPSNPRTDLVFRGYARNEVIATTSADGNGNALDVDGVSLLSVNVEPGKGEGFDTGTGGNQITADHLGMPCFAYDDNTVYRTDNGGTLSPSGRIRFVTSDGLVEIDIDDDPLDWKLFSVGGGGGSDPTEPDAGAALADTNETIQVTAGNWRSLSAATLSVARSKTLGTTGAIDGETWTLTIFPQGFATTIINGGVGAGSIVIPANSQAVSVKYQFDGTNWIIKLVAPFLLATGTTHGMQSAADKAFEDSIHAAKGTSLTNADATIQPAGGYWRVLPAILTAAHSLTLGTTGAVAGDWYFITRLDVSGFAYTIIDGGAGTPTLAVLPGGSIGFMLAQFDGTNWNVKACSSLGDNWVTGTALTDTATTTVQRAGRRTSFLLAGTMSQDETITLGVTGAQPGDIIRIPRTSTSAHTAAIVNGGGGAGTLVTLPNSKVNFAEATFDGTNWLFLACGAQ